VAAGPKACEMFAVPGGFQDARRRRCVHSPRQWSSRQWRSRSVLSRSERQPAAQQLAPRCSVQAWRSVPGAKPSRPRPRRPPVMPRRCWEQLGPRSAPKSLRGELRPARNRLFRPVAVRPLASCGAKKRGPAHSCERPSRSFVEAADYGSALDEGSGTASCARSELEIPASTGGPGRSRHCVALDAPVHQPSVVPSGAAIAMSDGDDGPRDARVKGPESDRVSMHGAQGADPRSRGPEGATPSLESLVAIFNDARRSLVRQNGGFSLAEGRMIFHRARNCRAEVRSEPTSIASNEKLPWVALGCKGL